MVTCSPTPLNGNRMLIAYDAWDDRGQVTGLAVIDTVRGSVPVAEGQIVKLKCRNHGECKLKLEFGRESLEVKTDQAALVVTATDECGNTGTCAVGLCIPD